jgi:hypothetical protein
MTDHYEKTGNTRQNIKEQSILKWLKERPKRLKSKSMPIEELEDTCDNCFKWTRTKVKLIRSLWNVSEDYGRITCPACHRIISEPDRIKFNKDNQKRNTDDLKWAQLQKQGEKSGISYSKKLRLELLEIIGNSKCKRCGFDDVRALQLDHIKGDGAIARKKFKNSQYEWHFYHTNPELGKKNLQVLCANCNWIKREENDETSWHNSKKDRIDDEIKKGKKYQKELAKYKEKNSKEKI